MQKVTLSLCLLALLTSPVLAEREEVVPSPEDAKKIESIHLAAQNAAAWRDENYIGYQVSSMVDDEEKDYYIVELTDPISKDVITARCSSVKEKKCHEIKK